MKIISKHIDPTSVDYREGCAILVNKPLNWTSFDVVNKMKFTLKHLYQVKKIKVGHAGTLDPLATGLLLVCTGKATKQISGLQEMKKAYQAELKLGATTPSYDAEYPEENKIDPNHLTTSEIEDVVLSFHGVQDQMPPNFSALKVDGQPMYKWTRKGVKKELKSREITIYNMGINEIRVPHVNFTVECSKGTYIRSIAHDIGQKLNVGAYLTGLCRLSIGEYENKDACDLETWVNAMRNIEKKEDVSSAE